MMRSRLSGGHVVNISKDPLDRIVRLTFSVEQGIIFRRLVIQLTGRSADLFLLDELNRIQAVLRQQGQARLHEIYEPPPQPEKESRELLPDGPGSPSAQLDAHFQAQDRAKAFDSRAKALRSKLTKSIRQRQTLREHLQQDLVRHGDPEEHKRTGDLLLANVANASRDGKKVRISDYYSEGAPTIDIEIDENRSLQEEAAHRFRQYTKAKRAAEEIEERLNQVDRETAQLQTRLRRPKSLRSLKNFPAFVATFRLTAMRFSSDARRMITTI
jgi:predicted ribosome quality control (RQC) complex YloA/Tae2 family protein